MYFTDSPRGGRPRRPDLAARAPTLAGGEVGLHAEIEIRFRTSRVPKLFDYNRVVSLRLGLSVHTVAVYCAGGDPGVRRQVLRVESLGQTIDHFHYVSLGLKRASAAEYLERPEPLAWALAALMNPKKVGSRAELRLACLRRIMGARHLTEEKRFRLFNFVATFIESDQGISDEYDELLRSEDNREVHQKMMTWAEKIENRGIRQGIRQGEAALLMEQASWKFGPLDGQTRQQIEKADAEQMLEWGKRVLTARSLDEVFDGNHR